MDVVRTPLFQRQCLSAQLRANCENMDRPADPVERAFQLAQSGKFSALGDIKAKLKSEGYSLATVGSPSIAKQLRGLIKKSQEPHA